MQNDYTVRQLRVDESHMLFTKDGMFHKRFPSDQRLIRYYTLLVVQRAPNHIKEFNLLEQQISELIKNAVKHGNHNNRSKFVDVWYNYSMESAHLIVQDEGDGFQNIEAWNKFNEKRIELLRANNFEELMNFISFRTERSDEYDGGNAMFAAVEYWNSGVIFNNKHNSVAVKRVYRKKRQSIKIPGR